MSSNCSGRVGTIVDTVRDLFNESVGGFISDEFILRSLNRCREDLAKDDYWRRETWITATSGASQAELLASIPDCQHVHQVRFSGQREPMVPLPSFSEFNSLRTADTTKGTPEYYVAQNGTLHVWPAPSSTVSSGYGVYHSYLPPELSCASGSNNPPVPPAHDMVFVYFTLMQAFLRDRHAPGADSKFAEYSRLHELEKAKLLAAADPQGLAIRAYRS
ncbi:MAG: hypothetical protein AB1646_15455 [Thermodesulfobacteriota bacterium]